MIYFCDVKRHLICAPYSIENLHKMAEALNIKRHWYHGGKLPHYDIPKRRIEEIVSQCSVIESREIVNIIKDSLC